MVLYGEGQRSEVLIDHLAQATVVGVGAPALAETGIVLTPPR